MRASIVSALLGAFASADPTSAAVPPHPHGCKTNRGSIAFGLEKDYDMGGCKCDDDTAIWGPGSGLDPRWACYCNVPDQYASSP